MEDYTADQDYTQEDNSQAQTSGLNSAPRGIKNKAKNKLKETGKKLGDTFKKGIKELWNKVPLKVKLIILGVALGILLIALFLLVILEYTTMASAESISNYMSSSEVENTPVGKLYNETGSLLLLTDEQVDKLDEEYLSSIREKTPNYYDLMNSKPSNIVKDNSGVVVKENAITLGEDLTIYKHILNSERYNFNRIVWKEYDRASTTARDIVLKVDATTRLQYPDDSEKDLTYFTNLARPYLQSWIIPFTMMSGIATNTASSNAKNLAYEIMSDAYHKIEIEKRNLQSINIFSEYKEYDQITYTVSVTRTCEEVEDPEKEYTETYYETVIKECSAIEKRGNCPDNPKTGYKYVEVQKTRTVKGKKTVCNDSKPVTTSTKKHIVEDEKETGRETYTTSVYNYKKIQTFDKLTEYQINVTTYDLNNDPDRKEINEERYYDAETSTLPNIPKNAGDGTYTSTYVVKDGTKYEITRNWNDSINTSSTSREYNISDIETSASSTLTTQETNYYNKLHTNGELNLIDVMNSNKDNYNNYVRGLNYSTNIGYTREQLQVSYRLLNKYMREIFGKSDTSFAYGSSLGLEVKYSGSLGSFALDVVQNIDTNATYVAPVQDSHLILQDNKVATNVYGYSGHTGIDISYPYAYADKSRCADYSNSECPYMAGPPVYSVQEGVLVAVAYSAYNKYYNKGTSTTSSDGNLMGGGGQGSYVKIKHTSPTGKVTYSAYWHLYPDYDQLKELSKKVGQTIPAGTYIGHMGNTGYSSGLHLHFEYASTLWKIGNGETSLAILRLAGM